MPRSRRQLRSVLRQTFAAGDRPTGPTATETADREQESKEGPYVQDRWPVDSAGRRARSAAAASLWGGSDGGLG